ncbi:hypothetical protein SAMN05421805_103409 [Saccharopolyspora antimicrobica]|uniref:Pentapeptide repeat-containing protein n=1 Tax=Saccharopolyspora antimicrobica TaxID=455193 RepID=A0A1I4XFV5_9PSEU|nr:hypothetical protein [Saccharopolyspora antimicrobica]RKT84476.1 hypothetical protein ATL45_2792 [Saccharopolyspora antimicrobica]SFN24363.1 hypothetical protein SAMN05421805_103409 [Saccharopolyspora antimicrobica]
MIEHTAAERRVLSAVRDRARVEVDFDGEQRLRGAVLADALAGTKALRSVRITGARIDGRVDLAAARLDFPIEFRDCHFGDDVVLTEAQVASGPAARLPDSRSRSHAAPRDG